MRYRILSILLLLVILAVAAAGLSGAGGYWIAGGCAAMAVLLLLLVRSMSIPLNAVRNGMYLLRDQDFSSRLRMTGQADADRIVELYNTLIDSMKRERLRNLEQNRFLSLVVEASPLGIAVCDYDGHIVETNPAWNAMIPNGLLKAADAVERGTARTVRLADALTVKISKLWFMDSGFKRDFILVERLTDEIAAAEKQLFGKIVRTIGHEVNNTLGSVMSVLESLGEIHSGDTLLEEAIVCSSRSCANLVSFVRSYADIIKLPPVTPEPVTLCDWIAGILPVLSGMVPANVSLVFTPDGEGRTVRMDPMLMERVMINIVKNSVESIGERPDGRIAVTVKGGRIAITDNGKGIADDVAGKLFTPFFSTKRPDRGLGLMLIADILRGHKAAFSLATSPETGLTVFSIDLNR